MSGDTSSRKLKKKRSAVPSTSVPTTVASTSTATEGDSYTTEDALQNASTALEALKSVGDAAGVLGPLKAICGVLKIVVDTAVLLKNNGEDLRDLVDKLEHHQRFLETEMAKLSEPEYSKSRNVEEITRPLQNYLSNLQKLYDQLKGLKARYDDTSKRKRVKTALKAQSDQGEIADCTQKLQDSFQQFMNAMTSFIARQTLLLRKEVAEMKAQMADQAAKDALSQLAYAGARGNQHETCMEGTRQGLLEDIASWADSGTLIFALVDQAGTGKSTIAAHMTRQWEKEGLLLARHFFSKPFAVTGKDLASTLAREIAESAPSLRPIIIHALEEHPNFTSCSIREQLEWIIFTPLRSMDTVRILVIDALDECSKEDRGVFLKHLLDFISSYPVDSCPLKLFLTCRPEDDLVSRLREPRYAGYIHETNFQLRPEQHPSNEADIRLYAIALLSNFLNDEQIDEFVSAAKGLFIWASTAYGFLIDALDPTERFQALMKKNLTLELLYDEIIFNALKRVTGQEQLMAKVLQAICVAREPLTAEMMDELLGVRSGVAGRVVTMLSSVLSDGNQGRPVHVLHPTFLEHVLNPKACQLGICSEDAEALVARGCLRVCSNRLKYDICDIQRLQEYPLLNKDIEKMEMLLRERTTQALRYAAINVLSHIGSSLHDREAIEGLRDFFDSKLLNWIELMSLYEKIYSLIQSIQHLKMQIEESLKLSTTILTPKDVDWCIQIQSMMQIYQVAIQESAMQVYFSALPFEPPQSHIARRHLPQFAQSIPRVLRGTRSPQSQSMVLCGHQDIVDCIAYAPDGRLIASGSCDSTVRLWDSATGAATAVLTGHTNEVRCLAFSPDGKVLASGSSDSTVRLWDPGNWAAIATLMGHTNRVTCLAFSPKGRVLASGSKDHTVRLWDAATGAAITDFTGHTGEVTRLTFSPDGKWLASGSYDYTLRLWDPSTAVAVAELTGHTSRVDCLAFSPDSRMLASASEDTTVRLWNPSTGVKITDLTGHTRSVYCIAFSPDGKMLASGSDDYTVRLWNPSTCASIAELTGHTSQVHCLAFSPDGKTLVSGSGDKTVRLWNPATGAPVTVLAEHTDQVDALAFSPDGRILASGSYDTTVRLWNPSTSAVVVEKADHAGHVNCLTLSPDGKMLASGSEDNIVQLWDPSKGAVVAELTGHTGGVDCIAFSPDGRILASGSYDRTVRIWDPSTGAAVAELTGHTYQVSCLAFSPDGRTLASGSYDDTVRLWDSNTCQAVGDPLLHDWRIGFLEFRSRDGGLFLLVTDIRESETLWNLSTSTPLRHSGDETLLSSPAPTSSLIHHNEDSKWTYIPTKGVSFQLPPYFSEKSFYSQEGLVAYAGWDGSIIIIDCTHLL